MPVSGLLFPGALVVAFAIIFCLYTLGLWQRAQSSHWARTLGRVEYFGTTHGVPTILYHYEANGVRLIGTDLVPSLFKGYPQSVTRSTYVHPDGRLKFPPNEEIPVFYDPANPSDAALIQGVAPGSWLVLVGLLALAAALLAIFINGSIKPQLLWPAGGVAWVLMLLLIARWAHRWGSRYRQSAVAKSVPGRVLEAKLSESAGDSSTSFVPEITYAYEVDGRSYRSSQQTVLNVHRKMSKRAAQAQVDQWKSQPAVTVFYDPASPWEPFLERGPASGMQFPVLFLITISVFGIVIFFHR